MKNFFLQHAIDIYEKIDYQNSLLQLFHASVATCIRLCRIHLSRMHPQQRPHEHLSYEILPFYALIFKKTPLSGRNFPLLASPYG